jgi:phosphate starvation-inducible PhoH-like protein|tara:strand:- start:13856 stop:14866 length:1011 start_codon:yes stop_codon:yes gene_type:complete
LKINSLKQLKNGKAGDQLSLEFSDNRLLIDLCGEFDQNISKIESALSVDIIRKGNQLFVVGESKEEAARVLKGFYLRLEEKKGLDSFDIETELHMLNSTGQQKLEDNSGTKTIAEGGFGVKTRKKLVVPRTQAQKNYVMALFENDLVFGIGPAGTGKTYLAVAVGVNMLMAGKVDKIILSRPAVEAGERLGFLPGDMKDKVDPFMQPLYDALNDFLPGKQTSKLIEDKKIEIAPLAFMRGRTLTNAFVVLDEAQNATTMQMKMFLTRLGQGSRMVVTGDRTQIDLPRGTKSGLWEAEELLKKLTDVAFRYFTSRDVVRHSLVAKIIEAYEEVNGKG